MARRVRGRELTPLPESMQPLARLIGCKTIGLGRTQPLHFIFPMPPRTEERGRSAISNKDGRRRSYIYTPQQTRDYKQLIARAAKIQYSSQKPLENWLRVDITFFLDEENNADWDNMAKAICDGMQKTVFKNDRQIKGGRVEMVFRFEATEEELKDWKEHTEVTVTPRNKRAGGMTGERTTTSEAESTEGNRQC